MSINKRQNDRLLQQLTSSTGILKQKESMRKDLKGGPVHTMPFDDEIESSDRKNRKEVNMMCGTHSVSADDPCVETRRTNVNQGMKQISVDRPGIQSTDRDPQLHNQSVQQTTDVHHDSLVSMSQNLKEAMNRSIDHVMFDENAEKITATADDRHKSKRKDSGCFTIDENKVTTRKRSANADELQESRKSSSQMKGAKSSRARVDKYPQLDSLVNSELEMAEEFNKDTTGTVDNMQKDRTSSQVDGPMNTTEDLSPNQQRSSIARSNFQDALTQRLGSNNSREEPLADPTTRIKERDAVQLEIQVRENNTKVSPTSAAKHSISKKYTNPIEHVGRVRDMIGGARFVLNNKMMTDQYRRLSSQTELQIEGQRIQRKKQSRFRELMSDSNIRVKEQNVGVKFGSDGGDSIHYQLDEEMETRKFGKYSSLGVVESTDKPQVEFAVSGHRFGGQPQKHLFSGSISVKRVSKKTSEVTSLQTGAGNAYLRERNSIEGLIKYEDQMRKSYDKPTTLQNPRQTATTTEGGLEGGQRQGDTQNSTIGVIVGRAVSRANIMAEPITILNQRFQQHDVINVGMLNNDTNQRYQQPTRKLMLSGDAAGDTNVLQSREGGTDGAKSPESDKQPKLLAQCKTNDMIKVKIHRSASRFTNNRTELDEVYQQRILQLQAGALEAQLLAINAARPITQKRKLEQLSNGRALFQHNQMQQMKQRTKSTGLYAQINSQYYLSQNLRQYPKKKSNVIMSNRQKVNQVRSMTGHENKRHTTSAEAPPTLINYHSRDLGKSNIPNSLTGMMSGPAKRKVSNNNEDLEKLVSLVSPAATILRSPTLKANHIQAVYRIRQQKSPISPKSVNAPTQEKTKEIIDGISRQQHLQNIQALLLANQMVEEAEPSSPDPFASDATTVKRGGFNEDYAMQVGGSNFARSIGPNSTNPTNHVTMGFSEGGAEMFSNRRSPDRAEEPQEVVDANINMTQLSGGSHFRTGGGFTFENMQPVIQDSFGPAVMDLPFTRNQARLNNRSENQTKYQKQSQNKNAIWQGSSMFGSHLAQYGARNQRQNKTALNQSGEKNGKKQFTLNLSVANYDTSDIRASQSKMRRSNQSQQKNLLKLSDDKLDFFKKLGFKSSVEMFQQFGMTSEETTRPQPQEVCKRSVTEVTHVNVEDQVELMQKSQNYRAQKITIVPAATLIRQRVSPIQLKTGNGLINGTCSPINQSQVMSDDALPKETSAVDVESTSRAATPLVQMRRESGLAPFPNAVVSALQTRKSSEYPGENETNNLNYSATAVSNPINNTATASIDYRRASDHMSSIRDCTTKRITGGGQALGTDMKNNEESHDGMLTRGDDEVTLLKGNNDRYSGEDNSSPGIRDGRKSGIMMSPTQASNNLPVLLPLQEQRVDSANSERQEKREVNSKGSVESNVGHTVITMDEVHEHSILQSMKPMQGGKTAQNSSRAIAEYDDDLVASKEMGDLGEKDSRKKPTGRSDLPSAHAYMSLSTQKTIHAVQNPLSTVSKDVSLVEATPENDYTAKPGSNPLESFGTELQSRSKTATGFSQMRTKASTGIGNTRFKTHQSPIIIAKEKTKRILKAQSKIPSRLNDYLQMQQLWKIDKTNGPQFMTTTASQSRVISESLMTRLIGPPTRPATDLSAFNHQYISQMESRRRTQDLPSINMSRPSPTRHFKRHVDHEEYFEYGERHIMTPIGPMASIPGKGVRGQNYHKQFRARSQLTQFRNHHKMRNEVPKNLITEMILVSTDQDEVIPPEPLFTPASVNRISDEASDNIAVASVQSPAGDPHDEMVGAVQNLVNQQHRMPFSMGRSSLSRRSKSSARETTPGPYGADECQPAAFIIAAHESHMDSEEGQSKRLGPMLKDLRPVQSHRDEPSSAIPATVKTLGLNRISLNANNLRGVLDSADRKKAAETKKVSTRALSKKNADIVGALFFASQDVLQDQTGSI